MPEKTLFDITKELLLRAVRNSEAERCRRIILLRIYQAHSILVILNPLLYQIHTAIPDEEIEEGWYAISELIREGKVRYAGVSNFSLEQIKRVQKIHPVASIQPSYSIFHREIERDVMDYCAQNSVGIISYSPLCSGLITEGMSRERILNFAVDDFRPRLPDFQEPLLVVHLKAIERLKPLAARNGVTLPEPAIAWVLQHAGLTSAIVGARCVDHIDEVVKSGKLILAEADLGGIEAILDAHHRELAEAFTPYVTRNNYPNPEIRS